MRVLNKYKDGSTEGAIYIGRGSKWGNPYKIGDDGDRDAVCDAYNHYLWWCIKSGKITLEELDSLYGHDLVCFCAPQRCHGETLVRASKWAHKLLKEEGRYYV